MFVDVVVVGGGDGDGGDGSCYGRGRDTKRHDDLISLVPLSSDRIVSRSDQCSYNL